MHAGECVRLGIQGIVAEEFEQRAMIGVAPGFGEHVDLRALMSELRGVNTGLNFELLNGVNGGEDDIGIEIRVGIIDAVEGVVVKHDALPARGYGLVGTVAALPGSGLSRPRSEGVRVGRHGDQAQVFAAVERQFGDDLVLDHRPDGCRLGLQQVRGRGDFDSLANLSDLENHVQTQDLLYLDFEWFTDCRLETRQFRSQPVKARRNGRNGVGTRLRGYHVADYVGIDIGQGNSRSKYHRTRRIGYTSCNFTERLSHRGYHAKKDEAQRKPETMFAHNILRIAPRVYQGICRFVYFLPISAVCWPAGLTMTPSLIMSMTASSAPLTGTLTRNANTIPRRKSFLMILPPQFY